MVLPVRSRILWLALGFALALPSLVGIGPATAAERVTKGDAAVAKRSAKVYINNRFVGRAPLKPIKIFEGRHRVKVLHQGQRFTERIDISPSRTIDYRVRF